MNVRRKIYLDLDGVFCDFEGRVKEITGRDIRYQDTSDLWYALSKEWRLFRHLNLIPGSLKLITMLQHHDLEILTALPQPTGGLITAAEDKRDWVAEHISRSIKVNTIVGGKNKYLWAVDNPGAVLIDDYERNIHNWFEVGGVGIIHRNVEDTLKQLEELMLL